MLTNKKYKFPEIDFSNYLEDNYNEEFIIFLKKEYEEIKFKHLLEVSNQKYNISLFLSILPCMILVSLIFTFTIKNLNSLNVITLSLLTCCFYKALSDCFSSGFKIRNYVQKAEHINNILIEKEKEEKERREEKEREGKK